MKCALVGIYKGVKEVKPGSFLNSNGDKINYNGFYKIIFDQQIGDIFKETELKIPKDIALNICPNFRPYENCVINLDITIYNNNNVVIKIVSIEKK